jgi:hypothetical protein
VHLIAKTQAGRVTRRWLSRTEQRLRLAVEFFGRVVGSTRSMRRMSRRGLNGCDVAPAQKWLPSSRPTVLRWLVGVSFQLASGTHDDPARRLQPRRLRLQPSVFLVGARVFRGRRAPHERCAAGTLRARSPYIRPRRE